jgi:hypothetical protein
MESDVKFDEAAWSRWGERMKMIRDDVSRTRNDAAIFSTFRRVVGENHEWIDQHHGARFCQFVVRSYVSAASLGVRRHAKKEAASMAGLLSQIHKCAARITFPFYQSKFPRNPNDVDWQTVSFSRFSTDGGTVSAGIVERDLSDLEQISETIETYADRVIAHLDARGFDRSFSFSDLESAIRKFDELVCRYEGFLSGSAPNSLEAVVQYPWERIFDVPLRQPSSQHLRSRT